MTILDWTLAEDDPYKPKLKQTNHNSLIHLMFRALSVAGVISLNPINPK